MYEDRVYRLGNIYPEITEIQTYVIFETALNLKEICIVCKSEIIIPLYRTIVKVLKTILLVNLIA